MGGTREDFTGKRFARLIVLEEFSILANYGNYRRMVRCRCDCGNIIEATKSNVKKGDKKSCGCLRQRHPEKHRRKMPEYIAWGAMKQRCYDVNFIHYRHYGGRGIRVCKRWLKFENFIADMGKKPSKNHSLGRIKNNGNYEPGNCRWETRLEQMGNTRRTKKYRFNGKMMTIRQMSDKTGLKYRLIESRLSRGWSVKKAIAPIQTPILKLNP